MKNAIFADYSKRLTIYDPQHHTAILLQYCIKKVKKIHDLQISLSSLQTMHTVVSVSYFKKIFVCRDNPITNLPI